ncbi:hypothetical protein EJG51_000475 [Undibacterium piscinae]|uniref:Uncharacterized protein n=1 Tax=Undibacterium piscinae TaxID=2495591 RepID=A0A6M3ZZS4_9BURK|nr:hypothetical protein EJG51_000475 [Undibacterium piscinae]
MMRIQRHQNKYHHLPGVIIRKTAMLNKLASRKKPFQQLEQNRRAGDNQNCLKTPKVTAASRPGIKRSKRKAGAVKSDTFSHERNRFQKSASLMTFAYQT